ncbi:MAG: hypothetical protein K0M50_06505 [Prolixibacteraceae bacterium]|nr:hypothetical protein [Prolixibacteraceae bacterium]
MSSRSRFEPGKPLGRVRAVSLGQKNASDEFPQPAWSKKRARMSSRSQFGIIKCLGWVHPLGLG